MCLQVCSDINDIKEEDLEKICDALPDAAARLANNGSPIALLLKDIPLHLALARALEQVLQSKPTESGANVRLS